MILSKVREKLEEVDGLRFKLPSGHFVPEHFHVTEVGVVQKCFIDCGGSLRHEDTVSFQLWKANDYDHRLLPKKLLKIIDLASTKLRQDILDLPVEVEYQLPHTIGKYGLDFAKGDFLLVAKKTDCLAKDKCGVEESCDGGCC